MEHTVSEAPRGAPAQSGELVYAPAVLILSQDLYPRKIEVIREYIQNASDAVDEYASVADYIGDRTEPLIKVSVQGKSLLVFDNGIGMDEAEIEKLKRIAYSEKKAGQEAGYKGIGRLAGIAVADKLKISSTSYGSTRLYHFEFRAKDMREDVNDKKKAGIQEPATVVINRHTEIWWTDIDPESHYTLVELRDINESSPDLLDPQNLQEYIGDIGPVDFAPTSEFAHGALVSERLRKNLPDYSPKTIYLSTATGERVRIFKPYRNEMILAEPDFIEIVDPDDPNKLIAFCWFASKGKEILGKVRPSGRIFSVDAEDIKERRRFAGLAYKLFGFTIGDRSLPQRTLWTTALPRALWFTGEIHIIDKAITPTTDRSDFVETPARKKLYLAASKQVPSKLIRMAQEISDDRKAFDDATKLKAKLENYQRRLDQNAIDRADLRTIREDLREILEKLTDRQRKCKDTEITAHVREVAEIGRSLKTTLDDPKLLKRVQSVADIASELKLTSKARKVFEIIMETLQSHYRDDKEEYHRIAEEIYKSLRKRY